MLRNRCVHCSHLTRNGHVIVTVYHNQHHTNNDRWSRFENAKVDGMCTSMRTVPNINTYPELGLIHREKITKHKSSESVLEGTTHFFPDPLIVIVMAWSTQTAPMPSDSAKHVLSTKGWKIDRSARRSVSLAKCVQFPQDECSGSTQPPCIRSCKR